eukprot:scaffold112728_cov50-Attheya_sp.AAC.2
MVTNRKGEKVWRHKYLDENKQNSTYPISNRITSSDDGTRLYVASASSSFYCLNSKNGRPIWKHETDSVFLTSAIYSPLNEVVYSIQIDYSFPLYDCFCKSLLASGRKVAKTPQRIQRVNRLSKQSESEQSQS